LYRKKKILVIASHPESLINFRGHLLNEFIKNNYNVIACAPNAKKDTILELSKLGVDYKNIFLIRQGFNPFQDIKSIIILKKIIQREKPQLVLSYTIKPVIYGSIAAIISRVKNIYSIITGIGYALYGESLTQKIIGKIVRTLYRIILKYNKKVFFQNPDDLNYFINYNLISKYTFPVLINGSGIDLNYYFKCKTVTSPITFLLIARLLREKGIFEFLEAAERLKKKYPNTYYQIIGWADDSPSTIKPAVFENLHNKGIIDFLGFKKDVRNFLESTSIYVLPSYREGTPRTVLEAMSMGRPIITTDAPGCRETVVDGRNGFLVPIKDPVFLEKTMERFIIDSSLIKKMGEESRKIAESKYDVNKVNKVIMREIRI